jgi:hypothetical protein
VADPYLKDTMNSRTGQPGLPGLPGEQDGFSLHSSRLDDITADSVAIVNTHQPFQDSMRWLSFYENTAEFVRGDEWMERGDVRRKPDLQKTTEFVRGMEMTVVRVGRRT